MPQVKATHTSAPPDARELWAESADHDARFAAQLESLGVTFPEGGSASDRIAKKSSSRRRRQHQSPTEERTHERTHNKEEEVDNDIDDQRLFTSYQYADFKDGGTGEIKDYSSVTSIRSEGGRHDLTSFAPSFALVRRRNNTSIDDDDCNTVDANDTSRWLNQSGDYHNELVLRDPVSPPHDVDSTCRALLVQNERLVARVKELEETMERRDNETKRRKDALSRELET